MWALALLLASPLAATAQKLFDVAEFRGMSDASAGVCVGSNLFLVANDEDNTLRLYNRAQPGLPIQQFSLDAFLQVESKSPEADLEGAALVGKRAYWIGSHGRNKEGKKRENRHRFFATDLELRDGRLNLTPVGHPSHTLLRDLIADSRYAGFGLAAAAKLTPKEPGALDIEGLAAAPEGRLLIGFRNPVPNGRALVAPVLNPDDVLQGAPFRFDAPMLLDLGGLGIRDMLLRGDRWLVIAGAVDGAAKSKLCEWRTGAGPPKVLVPEAVLRNFNPEALIACPDQGADQIQLLSDDGARLINGMANKEQKNPVDRRFRSFRVTFR